MPPLSREQSKQIDVIATETLGIPSIVLMENAGRGVADVLCQLGARSPITICCGSGNNGGDGFVIARHLDLRGIDVRVLLFARIEKLTGDAKINFDILQRCEISVLPIRPEATHDDIARQLEGSAWIVDALLGTGARGAPRAPMSVAITVMNDHEAPIVAVDLPSGLDCDTGATPGPTVRAAHTCTFVAAKRGFQAAGADSFTGKVHVLDIGVARCLVDPDLETEKES